MKHNYLKECIPFLPGFITSILLLTVNICKESVSQLGQYIILGFAVLSLIVQCIMIYRVMKKNFKQVE